ncbi:NEDD8 ultimate buster 1 [Telopea speciosissima]|uniref:NEDD8 ultimate buster 1 n=1 Tax=Telopea speciosissima TaxID=54955 RepID=UPI001CC545CE|nr:NEDD8 ultimate buster 1 [Telopea speciosissima]
MEAEPSASSKSAATMAKLKLAGAWTGVLEVELNLWTVSMLRGEVAKRSDCGPESIKLICAGKVLKDGEGNEKLCDLGIKNNAKILSTKILSGQTSGDHGKSAKEELMAEEERSQRLARIMAAAVSLAKRNLDGSLPLDDFNIELEDQSGQKVKLGSETDQWGLMMGMMLHTNAKHLIKRQKYKDALDVLAIGEEAFSLCDPKVIEMIDNVPILQIDTVWCYFMLRDISWLSMAGVRLAKAREGLERAHGKDSSRVRLLQQGYHPEIALYLRLELLEGVVAYHSNQFEKSRKALTSAQAKYLQLQVPDEALSLLMSMGYKEREVKRALRMTSQDVQLAVDFIDEERRKKAQRHEEDIQRKKEIMEQKRYGMTPLKKAVDLQILKELVSMGFMKDLAAEALRRNENDFNKALDELTNPETKSIIEHYIESKKNKRPRQVVDAAIEELVSMGFERSRVVEAVRTFGTKELALNQLVAEPASDLTVTNNDGIASAAPLNDNVGSSSLNSEDTVEDPSGIDEQERDVEMEDTLVKELTGDALEDYDIEVAKEGEAISEYLALLTSVGKQ